MKIFAGPVYIDFGSVHVKSKMTRSFLIRNDLRNSISVKLVIDKEELMHSY